KRDRSKIDCLSRKILRTMAAAVRSDCLPTSLERGLPMSSNSLRLLMTPCAVKTYQRQTRLSHLRILLAVAMLAALSCASLLAQVKDYSTIVVFGDSLSDTGNVAHLTQTQY